MFYFFFEDSESDLISIDKAISISIELNGLTYQGTLYASTNSAVNQNSNNNNNNSLPTSSATSSIKTDIVY